MKENFNIENEFDQLFKEQLSQHSSSVPSSVWSQVSSGLAKKALIKSIIIKSVIVSSVIIASTITYYVINNNEIKTSENLKLEEKVDKTNEIQEIEHIDFNEKNAMEIVSKEGSDYSCTGVKSNISSLPLPIQNPIDIVDQETEPQPVFLNPNLPLEAKDIKSEIKENITIENESKTNEKDDTEIITYMPNLIDTFNIPNVFTPNGDGVNDTYIVQIGNLESFEMIIFDMMFNRIFETKNKNNGWNGYLPSGEEAPNGQYIVKIIYRYKNNSEIITKQNTILLNK